MEQASQQAVESIVAKDTWTAEDHSELLSQLFATNEASFKFREMLVDIEAQNPSPKGAAAMKIGIGRYMLCRFDCALEALNDATDNKDRYYFIGQCYRGMKQYAQAAEAFAKAKAKGWEDDEVDVLMVEALAMSNQLDEATATFEKIFAGTDENPDVMYLQGLLAEMNGEGEKAADCYQNACALDPDHPEATFRLAYYLDLHGEEEEALALYEECLRQPPVYANALLNLAVLHEDAGRYIEALDCLDRLLDANPANQRARLFRRDVVASKNMYYDEDQAKRIAKRNAVLDIPVTDFELSVRARNCLKKMNIHTLGDLVRTSEAELLGYKNFGETSLREIKEMLTAKNLRLGQALEEGSDFAPTLGARPAPVVEGDESILSTPLEQIEFSVRARRVLEQLGARTIGDLAAHSEMELMAQKNFGQTSLNEMRQKLSEYGLDFRKS